MAISPKSMTLIIVMLLVIAVGIVLITMNSDAISDGMARIFGTFNLFGTV